MTKRTAPVIIGQQNYLRIYAIVFGVGVDGFLAITAIDLVTDAQTAVPARTVAVFAMTLLVGSAVTWFCWRVLRMRLEISEDGIVAVEMWSTHSIPLHAVRRIDAVDGGTLRPKIARDEDKPLYLPVLRLSVSPGDLPVRGMAANSPQEAAANAESLRRTLARMISPGIRP
jgi:hypothetical protein